MVCVALDAELFVAALAVVVLDSVAIVVELLLDAVPTPNGLVAGELPVVIAPFNASEASEPNLLSGERKATLLPWSVPCK